MSCESWRDTNNGGNVLSNIFGSFSDANIAQIYCSGELPQNSICQKYFQISDSMLLTQKKGCVLEEKSYVEEAVEQSGIAENKLKNKMPVSLRETALLAREFLWTISNWKTKELEQFIRDFCPDVIFAPCYSYFHVSKLALYVKRIAECPMISYISDDNYSLKQFCLSPSFWINRVITRKWIRRHFFESSFVYTMTQLQKQEYETLLKSPMKVLCKSADFSVCEKKIGSPIKLIYAGGLYLNRWKTLSKLCKVIQEINKRRTTLELHIYSNSKLDFHKRKKLNDGKNSFLHDKITYSELMDRYKRSDIAVHVESFDLKNRLITRLSFSTKIIDCMSSGCAILAIGPKSQAGISYLKENDAAICVNNMKDLYDIINEVSNNTDLIKEYARKANILGMKNHQKKDIENSLIQDFCNVVLKNKSLPNRNTN